MIKLADFLILKTSPPKYTKKDIDIGNIPHELYAICSIIRESFCLSYSIRKDINLYFYFENPPHIIKFEGKKLRYLGPDERSQALLLLKVLNKGLKTSNGNWERSTPGIYIKIHKGLSAIIDLITENLKDEIIFLLHEKVFEGTKDLEQLPNLKNSLYIIPSPDFCYNIITFKDMFLNSKSRLTCVYLPKIESIESKILYINFKIDQQQNL